MLTSLAVGDGLLVAIGVLNSEPATREDQWFGVIGTGIVAIICGFLAYRGWRRQQEQPQPGQA